MPDQTSEPEPERQQRAAVLAAEVLHALDPARSGRDRLPAGDRTRLIDLVRDALRASPEALNAWDRWLAGDGSLRTALETSLAAALQDRPRTAAELHDLLREMIERHQRRVSAIDAASESWQSPEPPPTSGSLEDSGTERLAADSGEGQEATSRSDDDHASQTWDIRGFDPSSQYVHGDPERRYEPHEPYGPPPPLPSGRAVEGRPPRSGPHPPGALGDIVVGSAGWAADRVKDTARRLRHGRAHTSGPGRLVSTGVASEDGVLLSPRLVLAPDTPYAYWLSIGSIPPRERVDVGPDQSLPDQPDLRAGTRLRVAIFGYDDEIVIDPERSEGLLELDTTGGALVIEPPPDRVAPDRLVLPVRTASRPGVQRLRCSIYHDTRLLQSRVLSVTVGTVEKRQRRRSITSRTDYTVSSRLDPSTTGPFPRLSVLANQGGTDTHQFRFFGESGFRGDASVRRDDLALAVTSVRAALRMASWGTEQPWTPQDTYRYEDPVGRQQLEADLIEMARCGRKLWNTLGYALGKGLRGQATYGRDPVHLLRQLMREPGTFEYACPETYRLGLPTAVLYDSPLDTQKDLTFCSTARSSLRNSPSAEQLLEEPCFRGYCPSYEDKLVVCPSGFWGYRHAIGLPVSLVTDDTDESVPHEAAYTIPGASSPLIAAGLTTDPAFTRMADHLRHLATLHDPEELRAEDDRDRLIALLAAAEPHVVYFLCHGGESDGTPGLLVGDPDSPSATYITPDNFTEYNIAWPNTRPLVVLNGCQTAALDPDRPQNFVDLFIRRLFASAVVGTEVTIFEPLAVRFAELLLQRFIERDLPLGEAVRLSRIELLREGNPLGLVYIPYGPVNLHLN